jgi:GT2 family glycosyltransferase
VPEEAKSLLAEFPDVISYHQVAFRGLPRARNFGWQRARFERIIYVDDDIRCGPELVSQHARSLDRAGVGAVAGGIDEASGTDEAVRRAGRFSPWSATPHGGFSSDGEFETDTGRGCNFSVWRSVIRTVGGVDEALDVGAALYEETDLFLRIGAAGYRIWFNGLARLTHLAAPSGGCRVEEVEDYVFALARNRAVVIQRHTRPIHRLTAFGRLGLLAASYARAYRNAGVLSAALRGVREGIAVAPRSPVCTAPAPAEGGGDTR